MEGAPYIPEHLNDDPERREKHAAEAEVAKALSFENNPEKDPDERQRTPEHLGKTLIGQETLHDRNEINYEHDPVLRHAQTNGAISRASGRIGSLLSSKSDLNLGKSSSADDSKSQSQPNPSHTTKSSRSVADVVMLTVIVSLLLLIILVIIIKG